MPSRQRGGYFTYRESNMSHLKVWTAARWNREIYQHLRDDEQGWHAGDDSGPGNTPSIGSACTKEWTNPRHGRGRRS